MNIPDQHIPVQKLINPFVGLRAFEEHEDYLFFGRNRQIGELLEKFSQNRFLAVIGSSGSGKSSLIKSGLLPAVYSGFMMLGSNWRVAVMRPGENPIGYLTKELVRQGVLYDDTKPADVPFEAIVESSLRRSENGLVQVYKDARLNQTENLLIVIDQFEELFRFSKYERENNLGRSDAIHFIQIILAAVRQKEYPIYVLLTMRSDFLGDCAEFRSLPEAINNGQYLVPRMTREEVREAIVDPVRVSGTTISQRLVTRLLNSVNNDADQLPILQHAMMRTWNAWYKRNEPDTPVDFEDYEAIGTMESALSLHADEAYSELTTDEERRVCELMFKALTDRSADARGIRRPRSIADLCILTDSTEAQVKKIVEIFRKPGRTFLMPPPGVALTGNSIVDISHESLMRVWQRLVNWTEEETRSGDLYTRLTNSAQLYNLGQRGLLKNPELEIALKWKDQNHPTAKWAEGYKGNFEQTMAYLEESREADQSEKKILAKKEATRRRLVTGIVALLAIMLIASFIITFREKEQNRIIGSALDYVKASKRLADSQRNVAIEAQKSDLAAKQAALLQKAEADSAKQNAISERNLADLAKADAVTQKESAIAQKNAADEAKSEAIKQKDISKKQTLKIAANEYARLIREGPSAGNDNFKEFYGDNYLLAYRRHFDKLEALVAPEDKGLYQSLQNRLYYNNDLYQRVYEDLEEKNSVLKAVRPDNTTQTDPHTKTFDNGSLVTISDDILSLSGTAGSGKSQVSQGKGQKFIAVTVSRKRHLIFCSATNNYVYVYDGQLGLIDSIAMGTRVTALDYSDDNNLVYFGTIIGYIGYIKYSGDKRNQPVFENKLETEITAIQLFQHDGQSFLLTTGRRSNPRVYKLDKGYLTPDSRLIGNELPYRKSYGDITGAEYVPKQELVRLITSVTSARTRTAATRAYLWNPFTKELLDELEKEEKFYPGTPATDQVINKTKIYSEQ